ncbi:MAG: hypothetical protein QM811_07700 [Pirellulales bacterium]
MSEYLVVVRIPLVALSVIVMSAVGRTAPPDVREPPALFAPYREGLVAFWDFQEEAGKPRVARGPTPLTLREHQGPIARVDVAPGGPFGDYAMRIKPGQWLQIDRADVGELDIHGKDAQVTVIAWVKRVESLSWQAVAGVWDETHKKRQYCLFLNCAARNQGGRDETLSTEEPRTRPCVGGRWSDAGRRLLHHLFERGDRNSARRMAVRGDDLRRSSVARVRRR